MLVVETKENKRVKPENAKFQLNDKYCKVLENMAETFGFNGLGKLTCERSYSRLVDGKKEKWWEIVKRVTNGTYNVQKNHILSMKLPWNEEQGQLSAQEMAERMHKMMFLPAGRGLWCMGTAIIDDKELGAALNNCGMVSTRDINKGEPTLPFRFMMDMSMLGVGVGFDCEGAGKIKAYEPMGGVTEFQIPDTREGWVESLHVLLLSYFTLGSNTIKFDYSVIRGPGLPLKTFGGISSGPAPLEEMHVKIREAFARNSIRFYKENKENKESKSGDGVPVSITLINDIMNLIGKCVISGNVRRSSEIAFGPADNQEFLQLKNYDKNPERMEFGWASNNSVLADVGMNYSHLEARICDNGEPGIQWLQNMKDYSRMNDKPTFKDPKVVGSNPCGEMGLESYELCNLVEIFPTRCTDKDGKFSKDEFLRTIKFAYLYAKTVSLCKSHWPQTNAVLLRNRRIGVSISGIAQFEAAAGIHELKTWLTEGYDEIQRWDKIYSDWLCVPRSIKTTTVKPSGSISLLAGVTPGLHFPVDRFYTRRVRVGNNDPLLALLKDAGHKIEPCFGNEKTTSVVEFPIDCGKGTRSQRDVSMWEQVNLAQFMQRYWADNQVSITVTFAKSEAKDLIHVLKYAQYNLKGISFLPSIDGDCKYPQLPYEPISAEKYAQDFKTLSTVKYEALSKDSKDAPRYNFCDGDTCVL